MGSAGSCVWTGREKRVLTSTVGSALKMAPDPVAPDSLVWIIRIIFPCLATKSMRLSGRCIIHLVVSDRWKINKPDRRFSLIEHLPSFRLLSVPLLTVVVSSCYVALLFLKRNRYILYIYIYKSYIYIYVSNRKELLNDSALDGYSGTVIRFSFAHVIA